ncbi:MAG: tetratricopeptide repeat protein, partial [Pseudomonadota bacterium]
YKALASDPKTAYVGVKGLLEQALTKGESERALKLANHGFTLKPEDPDLLDTLFDLQCEAKDWEGARRTLHAKTKIGVISKDVAERREAVLLIADASASAMAGDHDKAADLAGRAHKKSPNLTPATVAVAKAQIADGSARRAAKMLREAWRVDPHPDIAAAYALIEPEESPSARRRRFRDLFAANPDHAETKMLAAELALADNDFIAARTELGDLAESEPNARALSLKAAIERGEGAPDDVVRGLLAKAVSAPRSPQWTCSSCGKRHADWAPRCERCEAFDTLQWKEGEPDAADAAAALSPVLTDPPAPPAAAEPETAQPKPAAAAE